MCEKPSTSRERIIPIEIEDREEDEQEAKVSACVLDTSDENNDTISEDNQDPLPDNISTKRTLPMYNVKEKIVLVVDSAEDENFTPFKHASAQIKPLDMLKRAVEMFLQSKYLIDKKHEYALAVLNENGVDWLVDFTSNINDVVNALRGVNPCETEDIFNLNSLFDIILHNAVVPQLCEMEDTILPPPFILRTVLFYGRSYTMPKLLETEEVAKLLNSPYFTLDVLMTHEPVDADNNCNKIFNVLQYLDQKGFAYFFPVARDMKFLFSSIGKLLGHPLQRPTQKCANYSLKVA